MVKQTVTYLVSSSRSFGEHQPLLLVDANEDEAVEHQASIASAVVVPSSRLPLPQRSIYDQTRSLIRQNDNEQCTSNKLLDQFNPSNVDNFLPPPPPIPAENVEEGDRYEKLSSRLDSIEM